MLSGFLGALALLLAGLGLYGVMSYAVSRRRTELGIRLALGAAPRAVVRLVLARVGLLVGAGVVAGAAASLWLSRFVAPLLYGLQPRDPVTLLGGRADAGRGRCARRLASRPACVADRSRRGSERSLTLSGHIRPPAASGRADLQVGSREPTSRPAKPDARRTVSWPHACSREVADRSPDFRPDRDAQGTSRPEGLRYTSGRKPDATGDRKAI